MLNSVRKFFRIEGSGKPFDGIDATRARPRKDIFIHDQDSALAHALEAVEMSALPGGGRTPVHRPLLHDIEIRVLEKKRFQAVLNDRFIAVNGVLGTGRLQNFIDYRAMPGARERFGPYFEKDPGPGFYSTEFFPHFRKPSGEMGRKFRGLPLMSRNRSESFND
jgi:hypothetical protein